MIRAIDHIVILVHDLDTAVADYTRLGFSVVRGGDHPGGATHNALVIFADGAYLELIAFKQPSEAHQWWKHSRHGEGLIDYALLPESTADDVAAARSRGANYEGPTDGGRLRPDGVRLEWQTARATTPDLPFLCGDLTPRELRAPAGDLRQHANGAIGVAGITIAVHDAAASLERYRALLGDAAVVVGAPVALPGIGATVATLQLEESHIVLAAPTGAGPAAAALRERLNTRGEGPYAFTLATTPGAHAGALDITLAHGARIELAV
jgi:catechol 2,3-dioxygenase-like lactoylglutathione lyase family enzyme